MLKRVVIVALAALLAKTAIAAELGGVSFGYVVQAPGGWRTRSDEAKGDAGFTQARFEFPRNWNATSFADGQIDCIFDKSKERSTAAKSQADLNAETEAFVADIQANAAKRAGSDRELEATLLDHAGVKGARMLMTGPDRDGKPGFKLDIIWALPGFTLTGACVGASDGAEYAAALSATATFAPAP